MNICELAKKYMREQKVTQAQLALAIGINPISLNRYLNNQKRRGTGERLAEYLFHRGYLQNNSPASASLADCKSAEN